jgi:hypothetical protein|tara:strand:- start:3625 stop:4149 length:525 start_codon:yes stop_codon:yes gene_type:complete
MARNYRSEYANYHSKPKQKKDRAGRNAARNTLKAKGKVSKGDRKDVHHRDGNPRNNSSSNLVVTSQTTNRKRTLKKGGSTKKKGMGIKTSVKSGNFRATKKGAGMTEKGVKAYRKANPGSKLKTAVTEKNPSKSRAKRRKSFCARSEGQMKKFPKAAKDPNSRLRQARKRWRCR